MDTPAKQGYKLESRTNKKKRKGETRRLIRSYVLLLATPKKRKENKHRATLKKTKDLEVFLPELELDIPRRRRLGRIINLSSCSVRSTEVHTDLRS